MLTFNSPSSQWETRPWNVFHPIFNYLQILVGPKFSVKDCPDGFIEWGASSRVSRLPQWDAKKAADPLALFMPASSRARRPGSGGAQPMPQPGTLCSKTIGFDL